MDFSAGASACLLRRHGSQRELFPGLPTGVLLSLFVADQELIQYEKKPGLEDGANRRMSPLSSVPVYLDIMSVLEGDGIVGAPLLHKL